MKLKTYHIVKGIMLILLFVSSSCSTKKKSWVNRQYHNTTAKYNGYFNGNESLKLGVKKIQEGYVDDYTAILPIYKTGDLKKAKKSQSYMDKAIKKGSVVIQRHSMKIKGKEYCKWIDENYLLVGKAYFYKGEFNEAIKTFNFIKKEYKKNEIRFEASLWLIRSYTEKEDFTAAEMELDELANERKFPKDLEADFTRVKADFYLQYNNYPLALEQLTKLEKQIKRKRKKVRYNYIMAQIYQQNNNLQRARQQYEKVLAANPDYEMVFNAKMNLAQSLVSDSKASNKMRQQLLKMTKDVKNKEYLDKIFYTIAEMDIKAKDTLSAIDNYLLSTANSIDNNTQKAISFLALAKVDYNRSLYRSAKLYYDSTLLYMNDDYRDYEETEESHKTLEELVNHLDIIHMEDSLQNLTTLSQSKLMEVVNSVIAAEVEKERLALEQERANQQMIAETNRRGNQNEQFGNNTSGGKWYFYNPATLSFGLSEFRKKWGKRKLEDDWRRKDKKTVSTFDTDSTSLGDDEELIVENKRDPRYYIDQLPETKEDFEKSDDKIKESMYQAGLIYKEYLKEYTKSTDLFVGLFSRYPKDNQFAPLAYYNAHLNYIEIDQLQKSEQMKSALLTSYPNSIYAKMLVNPNYKDELIGKKRKEETKYQLVYQKYGEQEYRQVLSDTEVIKEDNYKEKYLFLRGLSFAGVKDTLNAKKELNKVVEVNSKSEIAKQAQYLLSTFNNPELMKKANAQALAKSPYLYKSTDPHMCLIILPRTGVDINYLKTLVSDYHINDFGTEVFEISAMLMGLEKHLLMIKTFENPKEAMGYNQLLKSEPSIMKELNKSDFKVLAISFENFKEFYKNKDEEGYYNFFKKNYLPLN